MIDIVRGKRDNNREFFCLSREKKDPFILQRSDERERERATKEEDLKI